MTGCLAIDSEATANCLNLVAGVAGLSIVVIVMGFTRLMLSRGVFGALDALGIERGREPEQAPAREMRQQERVRAPFIEPLDVAFEQRLALGAGERPVRDRLGRIGLHGVAKGDVMIDAVAEL